MKYDTFQKQFELLDDVPCMAATFEFFLEWDDRKDITDIPIFDALIGGFSWADTEAGKNYWREQYEIVLDILNENK